MKLLVKSTYNIQFLNYLLSMSTLHEERSASKDSDEEEKEKEKETSRECRVEVKQNKLTTSHTCESLNESQPKTSTGTPSLVSSGYGSQAASTSNLSSEDSISIKSISVDETPETEACKAIPQSLALPSVLSPPDVSVSSISPGEDTDHTMTETTPSSANITPSHSVELSQESQSDHQVVRRNLNKTLQKSSQRLSCPSNLLLAGDEADQDKVIRSFRRSVPDVNDNSEENTRSDDSNLPDWMVVGESVQVRPSNLSGVIAYVGLTEFAAGNWIGIELDTSQGKNNGTVKGVQYFDCPQKKGMFVRPKNVKLDRKGRELHLRRRMKENECFDRHQRPCSKNKPRPNIK